MALFQGLQTNSVCDRMTIGIFEFISVTLFQTSWRGLMMDVDSEECVVSGALALALRMSRVAGVAPLRFRRDRGAGGGWRVRASEDAHLYGQTLAVILCLLAISVLLTDLLIGNTHTSARRDQGGSERGQIFVSILVAYVVMSVLTLVGAFTGRQRMRGMVASLNQVHMITLELNFYRQSKTMEKKKWLILIVTVFGGFFALSVDYIVTFYENSQNGKTFIGAAYIFFYSLGAINILLDMQYTLITFTILTTLEQLNRCLEDLLAEIKSEGAGVRNSSSKLSPEAVNQLSYLQGCVCEAVRQADSSHGLVVLLVLSSSMLHLLLTLYTIIASYFTIRDLKNLQNNPIGQVIWGIIHFCHLLAIVEPCHRTQVAMERTKELVSQMTLHASPHGDLAEELAQFFSHLVLNDTAYCPMGMFNINRQLIVTMLSTITTYLVIVEQFT